MISSDAPSPIAAVVVLAAGAGSRMRSALPKPLHTIGGAPILAHALRAAAATGPQRIAVVVDDPHGPVAQAARDLLPDAVVAMQRGRLGTGDAARCGLEALGATSGAAIVQFGDSPLMRPETLAAMAATVAAGAAVVVSGFETDRPGAYGRLILGPDGALERIVEAADATPEELAVRLCNAGAMAFDATKAARWLAGLRPSNAQGEFYLTDLVAAARGEGERCAVVRARADEALGVNDRADLAAAEAAFQARARAAAMAGGATLTAPDTVFLCADTRLGRDVTIGPNVVFGPGVVVEDGARIEAFSHLEGCAVRAGAVVGPFARLRPGADVGPQARVGNFVEIKNGALGAGAKVNHLAYVGDATIGDGANIGAGTITCNYDGVSKHRTEIGARAFVGSNSALVAPVRVGEGAYVASGSVVTSDVPDDALAIGRARQVNRPGLAAALRARFLARKE